MHPHSIWIIGPSAVGKTTVSKIFYNKLKTTNDKLVLIDGDQVRNLYENNLGYDPISRSKNTYRYINLVIYILTALVANIPSTTTTPILLRI